MGAMFAGLKCNVCQAQRLAAQKSLWTQSRPHSSRSLLQVLPWPPTSSPADKLSPTVLAVRDADTNAGLPARHALHMREPPCPQSRPTLPARAMPSGPPAIALPLWLCPFRRPNRWSLTQACPPLPHPAPPVSPCSRQRCSALRLRGQARMQLPAARPAAAMPPTLQPAPQSRARPCRTSQGAPTGCLQSARRAAAACMHVLRCGTAWSESVRPSPCGAFSGQLAANQPQYCNGRFDHQVEESVHLFIEKQG
mmetsp:Transcript_40147/g.119644  ORF Transcript_40147/g.119644 Transcript_40147/m.119644 type:complete len:252 (-) Transcript_40147:20-775(-)